MLQSQLLVSLLEFTEEHEAVSVQHLQAVLEDLLPFSIPCASTGKLWKHAGVMGLIITGPLTTFFLVFLACDSEIFTPRVSSERTINNCVGITHQMTSLIDLGVPQQVVALQAYHSKYLLITCNLKFANTENTAQ